MSKYPKDLTGERFGRLTITNAVSEPPEIKELKRKRGQYWHCVCDCGREKSVERYGLTGKNGTKSCGCITSEANSSRAGIKYNKTNKKKKHVSTDESGKAIPYYKTRIYTIWNGMKNRCSNSNNPSYKNYGGRGIKVCERWYKFDNFRDDMYDLFLEFEREHGEGTATLDRMDTNGDYEPDNCKWATQYEQSRNKRNSVKVVVNGEYYESLVDLAKAYNMSVGTIRYRHSIGKTGVALIENA